MNIYISYIYNIYDIQPLKQSYEEKRKLFKLHGKNLFNYNSLIHTFFENQVNIQPDKIAVVYKNIHLTYFELNKKANKLNTGGEILLHIY